jgi:hypothetical protein
MGEWKDAYIDKKDAEWDSPNHGLYNPDAKPNLRKCWGTMDRQGKCENTFVSCVRVYCDDCIRYFESGEWKWKNGPTNKE